MAKCNKCGKQNIFLRLNALGMCSKCSAEQKRFEEEEKQRQFDICNNYYNKIVSIFSNIQGNLEIDDDPVIRLNVIPNIRAKIQLCDDLISLLETYTEYPYISDIILSNIKYKDSLNMSIRFGYIDELCLTGILVKNDTFSLEKIFEKLIDNTKKIKDIWFSHIITIERHAKFQETLLSLNLYNLEISSTKHKRNDLCEMPELKFSLVTAKSNYEKLGSFIVIDTETTGLSAETNEIIEVAAILFENWTPITKFETLINPENDIPYNIQNLTGISSKMVLDSPTFYQIIDSLYDFIKSYNIVGHNLKFDMRFLYKSGLDTFSKKRKYFDTLEIARKTLKAESKSGYGLYDVENYKLETLCNYYKIRDNASAHRALSDCLATGYLFEKLVRERINV